MKRIYIAAPFFNEDQLSSVILVEETLSRLGIDFFSPRLEGVIKSMTDEEKKKNAKSLYQKNISQLHECDAMIAIVDDKDTGTSFEVGFFACLGKRIITFSKTGKDRNLMLAFCVENHCNSSEAFVDFMFGGAKSDVNEKEIDE